MKDSRILLTSQARSQDGLGIFAIIPLMNISANYSKEFSLLTGSVDEFIEEVNKQKLSNQATDKWTVKDVLIHLSFWHKYYADQYDALANGNKPFVFTSKGGSTRNQEGVDSMRKCSKNELIKMLKSANNSLHKSIVIKKVPKMDYTDRNSYKTKDFIVIVTGHIRRHTLQVRRVK